MRKAWILAGCLALFLVGAVAVWYTATRGTPEFLQAPAPGFETLVRASKLITGSSPNPGTNELASDVAGNAEALKAAREALSQKFEAPAAAYDLQTYERVMGELGSMKAIALALRNEGRLAASAGKDAEAAKAYVDIIHLGTKVSSGPIIFSMVGIGIERIGIEALQELEPKLVSPLRNETAALLRAVNSERVNFIVVEERERHFRRRNSPTPLHFLFFSRQIRKGVESARQKHEESWAQLDALASKLDLPNTSELKE